MTSHIDNAKHVKQTNGSGLVVYYQNSNSRNCIMALGYNIK